MKRTEIRVTDHAVVRYLERVEGMDIDALRNVIGHKVAEGIEQGACSVIVDGYRYFISDQSVVSIEMQNRPALHLGSLRRRREIE